MTAVRRGSKRVTKAIIPAAGKGTRLLPLTRAIPKELVPLGRKPVLEHIVDECIACGLEDILFIISEEKTAIRDYFGSGTSSVRFTYAFQHEQRGLADAVYCGREFAGSDHFAIALGDSVIESDQPVPPFRRVLDTYEQTGAAGVIVVQKAPPEEISRYGIVSPKSAIGPSFQIDALVEKPQLQDAPSDLAIAGRYAFDPALFGYIEKTPKGANGEYQITDSIQLMLEDAMEIWSVPLTEGETRRDIGTFEVYFEAFEREIEKEKASRKHE